jgi:hypothetical protein
MDDRVWAGFSRHSLPCTDEYLLWCRQLMHPDINVLESDKGMEVRPLDSDEQAYEFLARCNYDMNMAKFLLEASVGMYCP